MSKLSPKEFLSQLITKYKEQYDDFTRKMMEDYFLILKDGRIVGSRPPIEIVDMLFNPMSYQRDQYVIKFDVIGLNCNTGNDPCWSSDFSPQGLDYDLYFTTDELSTFMNIIPTSEHVIIALPTFMKEELTEKNKPSSLEEVIAFRPAVRTDGEDKHLLFIYAPHLIELLTARGSSMSKLKAQKLRNHKNEMSAFSKDMYNCPDDKDGDYFGTFPGELNFFEILDYEKYFILPSIGIWKSVLTCSNCGKFYLSRNDPSDFRVGVDCPVCLITYPDDAKKSLKSTTTNPWFQTFIPEYPMNIEYPMNMGLNMGTFEPSNTKEKEKKTQYSDETPRNVLPPVIRESLEELRVEVKKEIQKTEEDLRLMLRGIHAEIYEVKEMVKGISHSIDFISGKKSTLIKKTDESEFGGIGDSLDLLTKIPQHLRRTFEVILKLDKKVTAKEVSQETGKSRPLESDYLNQLSDRGMISKIPKGKKVFFYYQKPSLYEHEENGLKSEQKITNKKREIFNNSSNKH